MNLDTLIRSARHRTGHAAPWPVAAVAGILLTMAAASAFAAASVANINLISSTRTGRTTFDYSYTVTVQNGSPAFINAVATVTSSSFSTTIVSGTVALGAIAANARITSAGTFTLQQDRTVAFDPNSLVWTITETGGIGNQINFQPPPPPSAQDVAAALPVNANGQPVLLQTQGLQLIVDTRARGPVEGLAVCVRWLVMCVQSTGNQTLDDCAHSAPVCSTSQPWTESQCCPAACFSNYQQQRLAGIPQVQAFDQVYLSGACYPGIQ